MITKILERVIAQLIFTVTVDVVGAVTDSRFTVTSSNTSWLTLGRVITIEGDEYEVSDLDQNVSFELRQKGHVNVISQTDFDIPAPFFEHGTWKKESGERDEEPNLRNKIPVVWLIETLRSKLFLDETVRDVEEPRMRLVFLVESTEKTTKSAYDMYINPLRSLVDGFITEFRKDVEVSPITGEGELINHVNAGRVDRDGHIMSLFNEELSGIELVFSAPIIECDSIPATRIIPEIPTTWDEFVSVYGRGYEYPQSTDQQTSFRTGDDNDIERTVFGPVNRQAQTLKARNTLSGTNFLLLNNDNSFGNKDRLTDDVGGQTYASDLVIDNYTGLMWYRVLPATVPWNDAIDNALASTQGGFSDWFLPSMNHYLSIFRLGAGVDIGYNYAPFNIGVTTSMWPGSTDPSPTTASLRMRGIIPPAISSAKTVSHSHMICRKHF